MALPDIFDPQITTKLIHRINQLQPGTVPGWGKMNAAAMLAHCNVSYELVYEHKHPARLLYETDA